MPDLPLYFSTAACWLLLTGLAWKASRPATAAAVGTSAGSRADVGLESVLVPMALVLHALLLYRRIGTPEGLNLGVAHAVSLLVWLTVLIYWLAGLAYAGVRSILGMMAPVAFLAVVLQAAIPSEHIVQYQGNPMFAMHFGIAMLAYSLFIVATVHALLMLAEEKWLHRGVLPPLLRELPPLLEMEALLFRILLAAFVLLTFTLASGVFFSEQLFGKPFRAQSHKMVFAFLSWIIFATLLAGHHFRGWRGRTAVRLTLAGFISLLLAYVGSKAVLELVLQRA
jgi:ABC-type uncharacterized transport system permease subunit